jgi:crossover junction endodeoxyribonuclease RusA
VEKLALDVFVLGDPAPQGSKKIQGRPGERGRLVESSKRLKPWRATVTAAVAEAWKKAPPLSGPVLLIATFQLRAPAGLSKRKRALGPIRKPDLSKLLRAIEDAITDAGSWEDDARVTRAIVEKEFCNPGSPTGVRIQLWEADAPAFA